MGGPPFVLPSDGAENPLCPPLRPFRLYNSRMSRIRVLPDDIANRIAVGEVVERPASIVKELIENSLDAGATRIVVDVLEGGRRLISVTDNGEGMSAEDAPTCLLRHATSKLYNPDDLFSIKTLGFRGEALPSIASVSRLTLETQAENGLGTSIEVAGGEIVRDAKALFPAEPRSPSKSFSTTFLRGASFCDPNPMS